MQASCACWVSVRSSHGLPRRGPSTAWITEGPTCHALRPMAVERPHAINPRERMRSSILNQAMRAAFHLLELAES